MLPLNVATRTGDTIYFGGIAPIDEGGQIIQPGDVEAQLRRIVHRLEGYLGKVGLNLENLVFVTVYLNDIHLYDLMNRVYTELMPEPYPARKVIETKFHMTGMVVEMTAVASATVKTIIA
jgi:enamine deaminase RidA (YjgF/YER057c/UK114 family)